MLKRTSVFSLIVSLLAVFSFATTTYANDETNGVYQAPEQSKTEESNLGPADKTQAEVEKNVISNDDKARANFIDDQANILNNDTKDTLINVNKELFKLKSQFVVVTFEKDPGGSQEGLAKWAQKYFNDKGIGVKDANSSILFVITSKDRHYRFEIGKGLKDQVGQLDKDSFMTNDVMASLKKSDWNGAISSLSFNALNYMRNVEYQKANSNNNKKSDSSDSGSSDIEGLIHFMKNVMILVIPATLIAVLFTLFRPLFEQTNDSIDRNYNNNNIPEESEYEKKERAKTNYEKAGVIIDNYWDKNFKEQTSKKDKVHKMLLKSISLKDINLSDKYLNLEDELDAATLDRNYVNASRELNKVDRSNYDSLMKQDRNFTFNSNNDYMIPFTYLMLSNYYSDFYADQYKHEQQSYQDRYDYSDSSYSSNDNNYSSSDSSSSSSFGSFDGGFSDGGGFGGGF